jgi:hypothetical protein
MAQSELNRLGYVWISFPCFNLFPSEHDALAYFKAYYFFEIFRTVETPP